MLYDPPCLVERIEFGMFGKDHSCRTADPRDQFQPRSPDPLNSGFYANKPCFSGSLQPAIWLKELPFNLTTARRPDGREGKSFALKSIPFLDEPVSNLLGLQNEVVEGNIDDRRLCR